MRRLAAVFFVSILAGSSTGCIPIYFFGELAGVGLLCLDDDVCSCLAACDVVYVGDALVIGECIDPTTFNLLDCEEPGLESREWLPRIPPGTTYESPAGAWFTLGSYQAGVASGQQLGFPIDGGIIETYRAIATYPPEFTWLGFDALGGAPVGAFGFDLDRDGVVDFDVAVLPNGPDTAYVDVDRSGTPTPLDVTIEHTGSRQLVVTLPLGGDARLSTIASTSSFDARVALYPGVLANPPTPGSHALSLELTSIDVDTGGPDDGVGDGPASFTVGESVDITPGPCPASPAPGCSATFERAALSIVDRGGDRKRIALKLKRGTLGEAAFGDPLDLTSHATCVYDGSETLVLELPVAAGGSDARGKPLWKQTRSTSKYRNKVGNEAGVSTVKQKAGPRGKVQIKGKGAALPLPALPLAAPVVVQHRTLDGTCVEATFETLAKNDATQTNAKTR